MNGTALRAALTLLFVVGCDTAEPPASDDAAFAAGTVVGQLTGADMREASGLIASATRARHFWLHNDSGDGPFLYLVDSSGDAVSRLRLAGVANRDWEDIARRGDTIFVAEIGDNGAVHDTIFVYAVLEPVTGDTVASPIGVYPMHYPDGARDAETLLVDPRTGDWLIVTKRESRSRVYRYPAPQLPGILRVLERVDGELPFTRAVGGDVSPDGGELLIKSYDAVYYWIREGNESLAATLLRAPSQQPYLPEPQGESIAFDRDRSAYYTVTEQTAGRQQPMLRYERRRRALGSAGAEGSRQASPR